MRSSAVMGGLLLVLGLTVPVAAQTSDVALATSEDAAGRAMGGPGMQAGRGFGGWQERAGHGHMRRSFVGMVLRYRQELGLSQQQVEALGKIGMDSRRAAIRRGADTRLAQLDLMELHMSDPVDMGKVEAKVREIEKLKGDGIIARFRTADAAKAQLTPEQKEKLKAMWTSRMQQQRRSSLEEGGGQHMAALQEDDE